MTRITRCKQFACPFMRMPIYTDASKFNAGNSSTSLIIIAHFVNIAIFLSIFHQCNDLQTTKSYFTISPALEEACPTMHCTENASVMAQIISAGECGLTT